MPIYLVDQKTDIEDSTIEQSLHIETPFKLPENLVQLIALIYFWDQAHCLGLHGSLKNTEQNFEFFVTSFYDNEDVLINDDSSFTVDHVFEYEGATLEKFQEFHKLLPPKGKSMFTIVKTEACMQKLYEFLQNIKLSPALIEQTEIKNQTLKNMLVMFEKKLSKNEKFQAGWLLEIPANQD